MSCCKVRVRLHLHKQDGEKRPTAILSPSMNPDTVSQRERNRDGEKQRERKRGMEKEKGEWMARGRGRRPELLRDEERHGKRGPWLWRD